MKTFTIDTETNNIIAHATEQDAIGVVNAESFSSAEELAGLAANWLAPRLIEIWNSIPGNTPVKKFTDRKTAATGIWKAIQSLGDSIPGELTMEAEAAPTEASEETVAAEPTPEPATNMTSSDEAPVPDSEQVRAEAPASEPECNVGQQAPEVAPEDAKATMKAPG